MILMMLDTGCRDDLDFILIENVTLFIYDLNYGWISLISEDVLLVVCVQHLLIKLISRIINRLLFSVIG